jgi:hypothetical protein
MIVRRLVGRRMLGALGVLGVLGGAALGLVAAATFSALGAGGATAAGVRAAAASSSAPGVTLKSSGSPRCSGEATFAASNGTVVDTAAAPGVAGASASNPILVAAGGSVTYRGTTGTALHNYRSTISVDGITVRSRSGRNTAGKITDDGTRTLTYLLPHLLVGTFFISASIEGNEGGCTLSTYVKFTGSPYATVGFYVAALLVVLGLLGLFMSMPSGTIDRQLGLSRR